MKDIAPRWAPTIAEAVLDACLAEIPRQMAHEDRATDPWRKAHHTATRQMLEAAADELDTLIETAGAREVA